MKLLEVKHINKTFDKFGFRLFCFKNFSAISFSLLKDKNVLEKTITPGKSLIFLFIFEIIIFISSSEIFEPLYNKLLEARGNDFNFTPSYNILIYSKYLSILFIPKSLFISL